MRSIDQTALAEELAEVHEAAAEFFRQPVLGEAVHRLLSDDRLAAMVARDPLRTAEFLGLDLPDGIVDRPIGLGKPSPDWVPFSLRLTGCRKYWHVDDGGKLREEEICRGFEIVPDRGTGPVGRWPW